MVPEQYMNETIGVRTPDGKSASLRMPVKYTDDDIDIARRIAHSLSSGTILTVAGSRFKVIQSDPPEVVEIKGRSQSSRPSDEEPPESKPRLQAQVGQRWVTKDNRRPQEPFEIIGLGDGFVLTDKGLRIQVKRLSRYKLVS
jgi:hypothetical protein